MVGIAHPTQGPIIFSFSKFANNIFSQACKLALFKVNDIQLELLLLPGNSS